MKKDFLNISPDSGGGSTQVSVTADPNLSFKERSTTLTFSSTGGGLSKTVNALQYGVSLIPQFSSAPIAASTNLQGTGWKEDFTFIQEADGSLQFWLIFKANSNLVTESSSPNLKFQISILASAIGDGTVSGMDYWLYVRKVQGSSQTGPFKMTFAKQVQAPFITFSWKDSGSFETLSGREIYYQFYLVNDDGSEENAIPVSFAVRYDM